MLTLDFGTTFRPGSRLSFGVDRDEAATDAGGNLADLLAGGGITARVNLTTTLLGAFANQLGNGFTYADGYGLIDAKAAVQSIVLMRMQPTGVPRNVSTRAFVGTGDNLLIGGFIVERGSKKVLVRALGPSIRSGGAPVPGTLADPTLELHDANGNTIRVNNNWQDDANQAAQIRAIGLAPSDGRESALFQTLSASNYTALVRGTNASMGNALVEVYDADQQPATAQLTNVSSRGLEQTGDNVMIGGFIIGGTSPADVVVRALGPSLAASNVPGPLADPTLELHDGQGNLLIENDNWQQDFSQAVQIQAAGLAPSNALESALAATLDPGNYTAIVRGANTTAGIGLVEMYNLQ